QNHSALKPKPHDHRRAHALRSGTENGTGVETFRQLQYYSRNVADAAYVLDLALRIQDLARLRAISQYLITNKQLIGPKSSRQRQAEKWHASIKPPADIRHLVSEWDCDNEEDVDGHAQVLNRWLVTERVNQTELERRLATFKYSKRPTERLKSLPQREQITPAPRSYLEALNQAERATEDAAIPTFTNARLYGLCTTPMETAAELRPLTSEEAEAIDLILAGKLVVLRPPPFLNRVYARREPAAFNVLFRQLEYPLTAHLEPGQVLSDTISHHGLLKLMDTGAAACSELTGKMTELRKNVARITYQVKPRTLNFHFRRKRAAELWKEWKVPFMGRFLPLFDYKESTAAVSAYDNMKNLIRLGTYEVTMIVRGTSLDMAEIFHLSQDLLELDCYKVTEVVTEQGDVEHNKWQVHLRSEGSPVILEDYTHIRWKQSEILLHHHEVYRYPPCAKCGSGFHPHSVCTSGEEGSFQKVLNLPTNEQKTTPHSLEPPRPSPKVTNLSEWTKMLKTMPKMKQSKTKAKPNGGSKLQGREVGVNFSAKRSGDGSKDEGVNSTVRDAIGTLRRPASAPSVRASARGKGETTLNEPLTVSQSDRSDETAMSSVTISVADGDPTAGRN
uniref:Uncharacterized protein n=1 Tax=Globisporangium ultimum (strain ATCC 200006 / CBS 805.95 / DAOM BR144) TaxID=431595 RepID=K3WCN0_GLOUD